MTPGKSKSSPKRWSSAVIGVKGVVTPGTKPLPHQIQDELELSETEHIRFRGLAARANYSAADRLDIISAAKLVCRFMTKPTDLALASFKRLARYLNARPRLVFDMPFQQADGLDVYSDTDWVGCQKTRKATSGECVPIGGHVNKCWSAMQASLALSSGEAEYYGVVRAAGIGLSIQALSRDRCGTSHPRVDGQFRSHRDCR